MLVCALEVRRLEVTTSGTRVLQVRGPTLNAVGNQPPHEQQTSRPHQFYSSIHSNPGLLKITAIILCAAL